MALSKKIKLSLIPVALHVVMSMSYGQTVKDAVEKKGERAETSKVDDSRQVAAIVESNEVSVAAARRLLMKSVPNDPAAVDNPILMNAAVNQLVDRHVVYDYLVRNDAAAGKNEVRLELERFKEELGRFDKTIEVYLGETGQSQREIQLEIAWNIAWKRYLKQRLTDDFLRTYFQDHHFEFDESQMRVAHLLIKSQPEQRPTAEAKASQIYQQLKSGQTDWDQAVQEFSEAPTRDTGGELGWISFHQPMPDIFSQAAFRLKVGEVSPPTTTRFGVHLIKCLEIKKGKTGWRDALDAVRQQAALAEFLRLASQHRGKLTIRFQPGYSETSKPRQD